MTKQCPTCGETDPRTGTCGTSKSDAKALCNRQSKLEKDDGDPVAWLYWNKASKELRVCQLAEHDADDFPVYTHPAPKPMTDEHAAAIRTLTFLGYTYHGAEHWKPPLGGSLYPAAYSQGYQQGRADELDGVRKPWIGLTFEEIGHLHQIHSKYQEESMETSGWVDFTRAVEAMIQGRNP